MKSLSKTWLTDPWIDAEYKSYILLAYLDEIGLSFEQRRLYPYLHELIDHFREAKTLLNSTELTRENFPKSLKSLDMDAMKLLFESQIPEDKILDEVMKTVEFSLPQMELRIKEGKEIFDFVEKNISMQPVGLIPLRVDDGYFFLENRRENVTEVYQYSVTVFESASDKYRSLQSVFITSYPISLSFTYPAIKSELIRNRTIIPNPATFAFESELDLPKMECYLPLVKRMLIRSLSKHSLDNPPI